MKTWTVTIVDENNDSYSETVQAANHQQAREVAIRIFSRDLGGRRYNIVSVVAR